VFFTHGLFGSPPPPRHKTFVNVWHGDGPKRRKGFAEVGATYIVAGTRLWGDLRTEHFGMPPDRVLVTGYPRVDQMHRPAAPEALRALGFDPDRPLVLLMPTYRTTDAPNQRVGEVLNWSDGSELSRSEESRELFAQAARAADERGLTLAVKPHPLDADRFEGTGIRRLDNADLGRARVTLYQLLGSTAGLITDYSSVWPDYLTVDRPIGFYCPDLDVFEADRGLNVDGYRDLIPGPMLATAADFEAFLDQCRSESDESRALRRERGAAVPATGLEP
jgi:CDP-glycerol glycerophosphotransferase (TagB/SpsB family)